MDEKKIIQVENGEGHLCCPFCKAPAAADVGLETTANKDKIFFRCTTGRWGCKKSKKYILILQIRK